MMQQDEQKASVQDEALDNILCGVQRLSAISSDINQELEKQDVLLASIDAKMDNVSDKQSFSLESITSSITNIFKKLIPSNENDSKAEDDDIDTGLNECSVDQMVYIIKYVVIKDEKSELYQWN